MKTISMIILLMSFGALNSVAQNADVSGLLNKQDTRTEIFNTILNDHQLMMEFMKAVNENVHALVMKQNNSMMDQTEEGKMNMKEGHHMMGTMKDKPEMMEMMSKMMDICEQDSTMCSEFAEMMSEHPQMMQMCMDKMKGKGMMDKGGKIKMMDSKVQSEKEDHNHKH